MDPLTILDNRIVKIFNTATTQALVQWSNLSMEDAILEYYYDLKRQFPNFDPWGQGFADEEEIWYSKKESE